jgi:hypothetical protein
LDDDNDQNGHSDDDNDQNRHLEVPEDDAQNIGSEDDSENEEIDFALRILTISPKVLILLLIITIYIVGFFYGY